MINPGPGATVMVSASADTLPADNISEAVITALVRDAFGNAVSEGTPVSFTAQGGTVTQSSLVGPDGRAVATFRAGLAAGQASVTASQAGVQGSVSFYMRPTVAASVALSINPLQLTANGTAQAALRATVLDNQGRPVSDGTPVTFTAQQGTILGASGTLRVRQNGKETTAPKLSRTSLNEKSGSSSVEQRRSAGNGLSPTSSVFTVATASGYAYATLVSGTLAGSDTVSAGVQNLDAVQSVVYQPGPAAYVNVNASAQQLPADGISTTPIVCRVTDAFGNQVPSGLQISITASLGQVSPSSGYTDANGEFASTLITSRQRGLSAVVASVDGASGYCQVTFNAPAVAVIILNSDAPSVLANGVATTILTATALDAYNLPVGGEDVVWQTTPGMGRLVPVSIRTDTLGRATAVLYSVASRTDVQQTVTATIGDESSPLTIHFVGITLSAWTDAAQLPANGAATTSANVLVRETTSGQAIVNASVRYAATIGSITQTATTNSSGIATATFRSAYQAGLANITAVYGDTLRAQSSLRLTSIEAETLLVTLEQNELLADGVSSMSVRAVVLDEGGLTVPNTPVSFTAVGAGSFFPAIVISGDDGIATSTYYSAALTSDQPVRLDVAIERDSDEKQMMLRGVSLVASSTDQTLPANGTSTTSIRVELRRSSSLVAIPNATIQLGANLGTIPASATTNGSGVALVTFTAGTQSGDAEITVRFGNALTAVVPVLLFRPTAALMVTQSESASLLGNGQESTTVATMVVDQSGMPLRDALINWSVLGEGSLSLSMSVTNESGIATNTFIAPAAFSDRISRIIAAVGSASDTVAISTRGVTLELTADVMQIAANGVAEVSIRSHLRETTSMVGIAYAPINFGTSLGSITSMSQTYEWGRTITGLVSGRVPGVASVIARYGNLLTDTVQVTFYSPVPHRIQVVPETQVLHADGIANTAVRAYVYDASDVILTETPVTWSVNAGQLSASQGITTLAGWTAVQYTAPASHADQAITITASSGTVQGAAMLAARGITINATAIPDMVIADGSSTSIIRAHVFETSTSVAIFAGTVAFGTTLGTIPNAAMTGQNGIAESTLRSATQTGSAVVTCSYGNVLSDQVNVMFAPSTPTTLSLTAAPTVLLADNISTSTLTAVVTDQSGNPVPNGTQVRFSIPPQSGSLENLRTTQSGVAVNTLTSSSTPDTVQIVAWAENNPTARDSITVIYRVGPPSIVTITALKDTLPADGISVDTITAHVTDAVGHILANVEVQFSTTIGNITSSRVTDANGNARVAFSSSQTGTAQVIARAADAQGFYTLYLIPGNPNSISMEYLPSSVGVRGSGRNETLLITATVRDANNNPVLDGTPVYFNINNSPGSGDFLSSTGAIPTINGQATVSYNSGTRSGSVRIRAVCRGISAVSTEILIYAGPPYIEDITAGCETSHMSVAPSPCSMFGMDIVGDSVVIVALVGDRYNNPVTPGTAVYFTTSAGVITTATGYTDSLGFARVTLYSGNPLPTIDRWMNTLRDPNTGGAILCSPVPTKPGVAKIMASSAGVNARGDSVTVWSATDVVFEYSQPMLYIRSATVNGDPTERTLYIGQNALIKIATYDWDFWPLVYGSQIRFSASYGMVYPNTITIGCPGDTTYTMSFFNNRTLTDDDAASPVLITVDTRQGDAYAFTETFTLLAELPPSP